MKNRPLWIVAAVLALVGVAAVLARRAGGRADPRAPDLAATSAAPAELPSPAPVASAAPTLSTAPSPTDEARPPAAAALLKARWGSRDGELGHLRPAEGNAEGPMSFALAGSDVVVLDQVNGRVVRYDAKGRQVSSVAATPTTQDVAIAPDGTTVLLDRLVDKKITLMSPSGRRVGELALPEGATGETGLLTGLFVDGEDVYVEKEHGALVRIGTTDGKPSVEPKSLQGRPSKDGALLLSAALTDAAAGLTAVNAFDRKAGALRFARQVSFARPAHSIALLDTDAKGIIYLGVWAGPGSQVHVACMDPTDGHVLGRVIVPLSETPEEAFRDFAVRPDGTIVSSYRTDDGVELRTARCP